MIIQENSEDNNASTNPGDENNSRRICPGSAGMICIYSNWCGLFAQQMASQKRRP